MTTANERRSHQVQRKLSWQKFLICCLLFVHSACAMPQDYYRTVAYYNNDPFTFCTRGVPTHCWVPVSKELGTYTVISYKCFNHVSADLFQDVCPKAFNGKPTNSMTASEN